MKHDHSLAAEASGLGVELSVEQIERLMDFERLVLERALPIGLISQDDRDVIRVRHTLDCLRAVPLLPSGRLADLGSGAGLPGIVIAIARPEAMVHLVEPRRRRLAFLELAVERLALSNALPTKARAEDLPPGYEGAVARALADARTSWAYADRLLRPGGRLVYFAGRTFDRRDLAEARVSLDVRAAPALLESAGPLVIMSRQ